MNEQDLSPRQVDSLKAILGNTYKEAGKQIGIRLGTVGVHLGRVKRKWGLSGVNSTFQANYKAYKENLVDLKDYLPEDPVGFAKDTFDYLTPAEYRSIKASITDDGHLKTFKELALELQKSPHTIKVLRQRARNKTGYQIATLAFFLVVATAAGYEYQRRNKPKTDKTKS